MPRPRTDPEAEWITREITAGLLDCALSTVDRMITRAELHPREVEDCYPSLRRDEVWELVNRRLAKQAEGDRRNAEKRAQERHRGPQPPDDGHDWVRGLEAARIAGLSHPAISQRVRRGTIPYGEHNGVRWFRRDHIEQWARARQPRSRSAP